MQLMQVVKKNLSFDWNEFRFLRGRFGNYIKDESKVGESTKLSLHHTKDSYNKVQIEVSQSFCLPRKVSLQPKHDGGDLNNFVWPKKLNTFILWEKITQWIALNFHCAEC